MLARCKGGPLTPLGNFIALVVTFLVLMGAWKILVWWYLG